MSEAVNHPSHYGGDTEHEVIKCLEAWGLDHDAYLFQAAKYIARAGKKDPDKRIEDLEKAEFCVRRRIDRLRAASSVSALVGTDTGSLAAPEPDDRSDQRV